jgi:hypothetical protein
MLGGKLGYKPKSLSLLSFLPILIGRGRRSKGVSGGVIFGVGRPFGHTLKIRRNGETVGG